MKALKRDRPLLLYLGLLHLLLAVLLFGFARNTGAWFWGLEVALLISAVVGLKLWQRGNEPWQILQQFLHLLAERQFSERFTQSAHPQAEAMRQQFNALLLQLRQERLQNGEHYTLLQQLMAASPSAIVVFDFDGRISLLNTRASEWLGLRVSEPQSPEHIKDAVRPAFRELFERRAEPDSAPILITDSEGRRFHARRHHFYDRGFSRSFLVIDELTDVLEQSERQFYEKLVRVLAHEVNNTVGATASVLGSLHYYTPQLSTVDRHDFSTAIQTVKHRNEQLGQFVERFSQVVKMPEPRLQARDLAGLLDDQMALLKTAAEQRQISLRWQQRDALPRIRFDDTLLSQAILNILKNALEAFDDLPPDQNLPRSIKVSLIALPDGALIRIADSANRLDADKQAQMFTPFFTTKKQGQGLGLLLVREVLQRHHWRFRLESHAGFSQFSVQIPRARW